MSKKFVSNFLSVHRDCPFVHTAAAIVIFTNEIHLKIMQDLVDQTNSVMLDCLKYYQIHLSI